MANVCTGILITVHNINSMDRIHVSIALSEIVRMKIARMAATQGVLSTDMTLRLRNATTAASQKTELVSMQALVLALPMDMVVLANATIVRQCQTVCA